MKRSRIRHVLFAFVPALLAAVALSAWVQDSPRTLYERARLLDEGNQNLAEAIRLYGRAADLAKDQPPLAANALVQMGRCQERLGQAEARKAYQRVLDEYPQQQEAVKLARERLAVLTQQSGSSDKPRFRKVRIPTKLPIRTSGRLSPDGRKLAFISDAALWVVPVQGKSDPDMAGAPVRLTESMNAWDNVNVSIAWSGDGKWIGFRTGSVNDNRNPIEGLYIVPAEGGQPERLPFTSKDWPIDVFTLRYALSPGAANLFFADGTTAPDLRIYSVPARGGERRPFTEPITREPALSPDGSRIAYIKMMEHPDGRVVSHQIWTRSVYGGNPAFICEVSSSTLCPVWSPDGTMIAFLWRDADRDNFNELWVVPIDADGNRGAAPTQFDLPDFDSQRGLVDLLAGWTPDNKIGILIPSPQVVALYTVPADGGKAVQLTSEYTAMPRWTPDGARIYFDGTHGGRTANIEYVAGEGGAVTRLPVRPDLQVLFPSQMSISADGRTLCYAGYDRSGGPDPGPHLYTVPVEGGTASPIPIDLPIDKASPSSSIMLAPEWSPDGTEIAFLRPGNTDPGSQTYNIYVVSREGGRPRQVSIDADRVHLSNLAWSPDGGMFAFFGQDNTLRVIPAAGGSSRILTPSASGPWAGIDWSPDGKRIVFTTAGGLRVVSREGGKSTTIATGLDARHLKVDWSPDGKRIAFTASSGGEPELWFMEDFLPLVNGRK